MQPHHRQQLDRIPQALRQPQVRQPDVLDPVDHNLVRPHPQPIADPGQNDRLVRRVPSVDIKRWIGLRIAPLLCFS